MSSRILTALAALAAACTLAPAAEASGRACPPGAYAYAGYQSPVEAHGVSARVTVQAAPKVASGHVAAWIGVGGEGLGPGGSDEWIQVGIAGFPGGRSELYYEFLRPGRRPVYVSLGRTRPGRSHTLTVAEWPGRPNTWRVLVDGRPRSRGIVLPGSHGAWRPIATAETWDGGTGACNRFAYDFGDIELATRLGGGWVPFALANRMTTPGYRVLARTSGFTAAAL